MASAVDICNLALSHIGHKAVIASISPPDASYEAQACARFYPIARNMMLEMHAWGLATERVVLAELEDAAPDSWEYAYAMPNSVISVLSILDEDATEDSPTAAYIREGDEIYTNVENATMRCVKVETDTTKYTPLLVQAIALQLGAFLAGNIIKGDEGRNVAKDLARQARGVFGAAATSDANGTRTNTYRDMEGSSIEARR